MWATWCAVKKSLIGESDVPEEACNSRRSSTACFSCGSISNIKDVINGRRRPRQKLLSDSPLSSRSSEVPVSNSSCEFSFSGIGQREGGSAALSRNSTSSSSTSLWEVASVDSMAKHCLKCGEHLKRCEDAEAHHLSKHAVTELINGDSSRSVIERIVQTGHLRPVPISKILKVHNPLTTIAQFEEYREMVKIRAHKLSKNQPRCSADGNELLRFHPTTYSCSFGTNGPPALCKSDQCDLCRVLRRGFPNNVFTASTGEGAYEYLHRDKENLYARKGLILCRVVAGRVQKPVDRVVDKAVRSGFDSVAGKVGSHNSIEQLYSLDPGALLPCFVILC